MSRPNKILPCESNFEKRNVVVVTVEEGKSGTFFIPKMDSDGLAIMPQKYREISLGDIQVLFEALRYKDYELGKNWAGLFKDFEGFCKEDGKFYVYRELPSFPNCTLQTAEGKLAMSIPLSEEASNYLAYKFPATAIDGCSSIRNDGVWLKIKPDNGLINSVIKKIEKDVEKMKLPPDVDEAKAKEIIADLKRIINDSDRPAKAICVNIENASEFGQNETWGLFGIIKKFLDKIVIKRNYGK